MVEDIASMTSDNVLVARDSTPVTCAVGVVFSDFALQSVLVV